MLRATFDERTTTAAKTEDGRPATVFRMADG
jgi:hypothetical protein